jgi:hypothetical protein
VAVQAGDCALRKLYRQPLLLLGAVCAAPEASVPHRLPRGNKKSAGTPALAWARSNCTFSRRLERSFRRKAAGHRVQLTTCRARPCYRLASLRWSPDIVNFLYVKFFLYTVGFFAPTASSLHGYKTRGVIRGARRRMMNSVWKTWRILLLSL